MKRLRQIRLCRFSAKKTYLSAMKYLLLLGWLCMATTAQASTWLVGPARQYTQPSQVANLVAAGDTIDIDPGLYPGDVCTWTADRLLLRCTAAPLQYAHLRADGQNAGGKAIWVIKGDSVQVQGIEFSLCQVPDHNGAGIRAEGQHLFIKYCFFHHNEMGILTNNDPEAEYVIEHSEFAYNGYGDGYSHNVYVGKVKRLVFQYNYSHHGKVGHLLKSRARYNIIRYNRLSDEPGADASREIDLPNGGVAIITGNLIQQSAESQNDNIVGYGMEGLSNPGPHHLILVHNTLVNQRPSGRFVQFPAGLDTLTLWNNLLAGPGALVDAPAWPTHTDSAGNLIIPNLNMAGLADYNQFDYHLLATSPALNAGAPNPPFAPVYSYLHPMQGQVRTPEGAPDAGAYELQMPLAIGEAFKQTNLGIFPNPATDRIAWTCPDCPAEGTTFLYLYDMQGRVWFRGAHPAGQTDMNISFLPPGQWLLELLYPGDGKFYRGFWIKL
jgi:hypothetical protein